MPNQPERRKSDETILSILEKVTDMGISLAVLSNKMDANYKSLRDSFEKDLAHSADSFTRHEVEDVAKFKDIHFNIREIRSSMQKITWIGVAVFIIVAANGGISAIKTLFKV